MEEELLAYYTARADEYEEIYDLPFVQADYERLAARLRDHLADRDVLEVACGTGYWTREVADHAASVVGVDASPTVLRRARAKEYAGTVGLVRADAYRLPFHEEAFSGALAGFWLSHVPVERRREFFDGFHDVLADGARVCVFDNRYVEGFTELDEEDDAGNTYEVRVLDDGSRHRVLKNFPTEDELRSLLAADATGVEYEEFDFLRLLSYTVT